MATAGETFEEMEERFRKKAGAVEKTIFHNELLRLFEQGLTGEDIYRNTIAEIDQLRKVYHCDPDDVSQALMKALLVLPLQLIATKHFEVYRTKFEQVLQRFKLLLHRFKKKTDTYKNYLRGVRLGVDVLIDKQVLTMNTELELILATLKDETQWAFTEISEDVSAGLYGRELEMPDTDDTTPAKVIFLHKRNPAMYDDMNVTEEEVISDDKSNADVDMPSEEDEERVQALVNHAKEEDDDVLAVEDLVNDVKLEPWQSALRHCYSKLVKNLRDVSSIFDELCLKNCLTSKMRNRINAANPDGRHSSGDHPHKSSRGLDCIMSKSRDDGQSCFCHFLLELLLRGQADLVAMLGEGLRIAWVQRDYVIEDGAGTNSRQLRDNLVNLETNLFMHLRGASIDNVQSIRNALGTNIITRDQVTELLTTALLPDSNLDVSDATDAQGFACYLYKNVQRQDSVTMNVQRQEELMIVMRPDNLLMIVLRR